MSFGRGMLLPSGLTLLPAGTWTDELRRTAVGSRLDGMLREWLSMPYTGPANPGEVDERERFIWGATAGMLRNLYRFLSA